MQGGADGPEEIVYLDVRTEGEFQQVRVPGSVLLTAFDVGPSGGMEPVPGFVDSVKEKYPDAGAVEFVVGCRSGARSNAVSAALMGEGYKASNIAGGILEWSATGLPTESG